MGCKYESLQIKYTTRREDKMKITCPVPDQTTRPSSQKIGCKPLFAFSRPIRHRFRVNRSR
jgi:hypothetical protein